MAAAYRTLFRPRLVVKAAASIRQALQLGMNSATNRATPSPFSRILLMH